VQTRAAEGCGITVREHQGKIRLNWLTKPFGEWNSFKIRQIGARTSVWLNGKHVVDNAIMENYFDRPSPLFLKGPIMLQTHGGEIRWRNIFIREIPAEEANQILAESRADGFESKFQRDGSDRLGWCE
jgi:hypothetical protein